MGRSFPSATRKSSSPAKDRRVPWKSSTRSRKPTECPESFLKLIQAGPMPFSRSQCIQFWLILILAISVSVIKKLLKIHLWCVFIYIALWHAMALKVDSQFPSYPLKVNCLTRNSKILPWLDRQIQKPKFSWIDLATGIFLKTGMAKFNFSSNPWVGQYLTNREVASLIHHSELHFPNFRFKKKQI